MSYKLEKLNELIKQELGKILLEEEEFGQGVLVTILGAETSQDLHQTTIVVSVWPNEKSEKILNKLSSHIFFIQQMLNKKIQMHPVPKIRFILNSDGAESQKVDNLIESLKKTNS
jgi:ribosome-binding factor A